MSNKELLMAQIDTLPDSVVEKVLEFVSFQRYSLGLFDNDTDYLRAIPDMAGSIAQGIKTSDLDRFETKGGTLEYLFKDYDGTSFQTELSDLGSPAGNEKW
jgi:hypothetical protein